MNINKPIANPKLKELIGKMKREQTDQNLNNALEEITMNASFLSVVTMSEPPERNADSTATLKKDTLVQFPIISDTEGKKYYPIFTDWEEVAKWNLSEPPQAMIMGFDDYYAMLCSNEDVEGLAVNPFSDNMVLTRNMLKLMRMQKDIIEKGVSKQVVNKATEVKLSEPISADGSTAFPQALANAICKCAKANSSIRSIWLRMMNKDNQISYLAVVDFDGDREQTFGQLANEAQPHLNNFYLDMVDYECEFGKNAVENVEPIYKKKKGLFSK